MHAPAGDGADRLCVQWPRLGPYHLARLRATHTRLAAEGGSLVALETASTDTTYAWREERGGEAFGREQVFPGAVVETLPPRQIFRGVTAALDRLRPTAVAINSYSAPDAQAALLWCRRHRLPAVVMMESQAGDASRSPLRELVKGTIVRQFDAALAGGTPQRAYLEQLGFPPDFIFVPYDVVDNAFFRDGAARARADPQAHRHLPGLHDEGPFFLASARLVDRKNIARLLRAYAHYRARVAQPWRLVVLGDGPERGNLEQIAATEGSGGVTFAGFRQLEDLPAYYGRAGAFVHPAMVEPWGLVVNEAMAAGLPVVVSKRVGASEDLVRDGENGYRFDPERQDELVEALVAVADPAADRTAMGLRSAALIEGWAPERFAEGLLRAVRAGATRAHRPASPLARLLLWGMRTGSRESGTFHVLRD